MKIAGVLGSNGFSAGNVSDSTAVALRRVLFTLRKIETADYCCKLRVRNLDSISFICFEMYLY